MRVSLGVSLTITGKFKPLTCSLQNRLYPLYSPLYFSSTNESAAIISKIPEDTLIDSQSPPSKVQSNHLLDTPASFFRRQLPGNLISFTSNEGKEIFREAIKEQFMESYFPLSQQFMTQQEPAFCGLTTLSMCLNALEIDPKRNWKGPWRYFAEELLDCCTPIETVKQRGITFSEFACLAQCNGASVQMKRADCSSLGEFRSAIRDATSRGQIQSLDQSERGPFLVASYARPVLGQTGTGHFSPIGGYYEKLDLALVLDTARFKYISHWVPVSLLWQSMQAIDPSTNRCRGFFILNNSQKPAQEEQPMVDSWKLLAEAFFHKIPSMIRLCAPRTVEQVIKLVVDHLPMQISEIQLDREDFVCSNDTVFSVAGSTVGLSPLNLTSHPLSEVGGAAENLETGRKKSCSTKCQGIKPCDYPVIQNATSNTSYSDQTENSSRGHELQNDFLHFYIEQTEVYQLVKGAWPPQDWPTDRIALPSIHLVTLVLLACPSQIFASFLHMSLRVPISDMRSLDCFPPVLQAQILRLRGRMFHDNQSCLMSENDQHQAPCCDNGQELQSLQSEAVDIPRPVQL